MQQPCTTGATLHKWGSRALENFKFVIVSKLWWWEPSQGLSGDSRRKCNGTRAITSSDQSPMGNGSEPFHCGRKVTGKGGVSGGADKDPWKIDAFSKIRQSRVEDRLSSFNMLGETQIEGYAKHLWRRSPFYPIAKAKQMGLNSGQFCFYSLKSLEDGTWT